ncbi:putative cell surface protein [Paratrimastix pyriformis]|uniref:Cell surface protein n=1 Tax=Paratrimastix pyriformis TaxID=342808 RepID=A0ABQ8UHX6_9EUKA|nr:putative cell surface protein [Paratrimastix pyriformis]
MDGRRGLKFWAVVGSRRLVRLSWPELPQLMGKVHGSIGSGARDSNSFKLQMDEGDVPDPASVREEGVYAEHYFDTGVEHDKLIALRPMWAHAADPLSGDHDVYLGFSLLSKFDGDGIRQLGRPPLNTALVLDISGSMGSPFSRKDEKAKIEVAKVAFKNLISRLQPKDRVCVITFDDRAEVVLPFQTVGELDRTMVNDKIDGLHPRGGTCLEAGIREAAHQFEFLPFDELCENRVFFLTDMCPNIGGSDGASLHRILTELSTRPCPVLSSVIGIGVDFDASLTSALAVVRGCTSFSVHSEAEFAKMLSEDFAYIVCTLCFNVACVMPSNDKFYVERVFGSPGHEIPRLASQPRPAPPVCPPGESAVSPQPAAPIQTVAACPPLGEAVVCLEMNSIQPSAKREAATKGGVVLLRLRPRPEAADTWLDADLAGELRLEYDTKQGEHVVEPCPWTLPCYRDLCAQEAPAAPLVAATTTTRSGPVRCFYSGQAMRKAVALTRYAHLLRAWAVEERRCEDHWNEYYDREYQRLHKAWSDAIYKEEDELLEGQIKALLAAPLSPPAASGIMVPPDPDAPQYRFHPAEVPALEEEEPEKEYTPLTKDGGQFDERLEPFTLAEGFTLDHLELPSNKYRLAAWHAQLWHWERYCRQVQRERAGLDLPALKAREAEVDRLEEALLAARMARWERIKDTLVAVPYVAPTEADVLLAEGRPIPVPPVYPPGADIPRAASVRMHLSAAIRAALERFAAYYQEEAAAMTPADPVMQEEVARLGKVLASPAPEPAVTPDRDPPRPSRPCKPWRPTPTQSRARYPPVPKKPNLPLPKKVTRKAPRATGPTQPADVQQDEDLPEGEDGLAGLFD